MALKHQQARTRRHPTARLTVALATAALAVTVASSTSHAITEPGCRIQASAAIATGDSVGGTVRSTDLAASVGSGHWRHTTPAGERFRADIGSASCHRNTGSVGDFEGVGRFAGSDVDLTLMAHVEDLAGFGAPDFYSMAIFDGPTLIYTTAGPVVDGDFRVTVMP